MSKPDLVDEVHQRAHRARRFARESVEVDCPKLLATRYFEPSIVSLANAVITLGVVVSTLERKLEALQASDS